MLLSSIDPSIASNALTIAAAAVGLYGALARLLSKKLDEKIDERITPELKLVTDALHAHMDEEINTITAVRKDLKKDRKNLKAHMEEDRRVLAQAAEALDRGQLELLRRLPKRRTDDGL